MALRLFTMRRVKPYLPVSVSLHLMVSPAPWPTRRVFWKFQELLITNSGSSPLPVMGGSYINILVPLSCRWNDSAVFCNIS